MKASDSPFYHKTILAPMVRVCCAGFRELCILNGADVVFSEEVVAAKLATCVREVVTYPTVSEPIAEYVTYDAYKKVYKRGVAFHTPVRDDAHGGATVILQLGVADPAKGAAAAAVCCDDVDGIDVNMGCPKKFSVQSGFGAALMEKPTIAGAILRSVAASANSPHRLEARSGRPIYISMKTRLKKTATETVAMLRDILQAAGHCSASPVLHAITLHARTRDMRSTEEPLYDQAAEVVRSCRADPLFSGLCFVLNGSILSRRDGEEKQARYGFDAAMIARAAIEDPRCFQHCSTAATLETPSHEAVAGQAYAMEGMKQIFMYSLRYQTLFNNFKYLLTRAFPAVEALKPKMEAVQDDLKCYNDCLDFFSLTAEEKKFLETCTSGVVLVSEPPPSAKRIHGNAAAPAKTSKRQRDEE